MTGYGKAELNLTNKNFTIEVKSLNSKQIDTNVKMPFIYRDKEIGLRNLVAKKLHRGKIEISIWRDSSESYSNYTLNNELIIDYFKQIQEIRKELVSKENISSINSFESDLIPSLLKMPDVIQKGEEKNK
jgi:uncharacterized protein (TIGR00255 family)